MANNWEKNIDIGTSLGEGEFSWNMYKLMLPDEDTRLDVRIMKNMKLREESGPVT